mgnify:CR=1 FL=1
MKGRLVAIAGLLALVTNFTACDTKATREECEDGCKNITTIVYAKLDETINKDSAGENQQRINKLKMEFAKGMWDYFYEQCVEECTNHQTRKMTDCMKNAGSIEEVKACK